MVESKEKRILMKTKKKKSNNEKKIYSNTLKYKKEIYTIIL